MTLLEKPLQRWGDVFSVEGPHHTSMIRAETRARAVLCLACASELTEALEADGYEVVVSSSIEQAVDMASAEVASIVVLDQGAPDWMRHVSDLRHERPDVLVVMISTLDSSDEFLAAVAAGVDGFCTADASTAAVVRTIHSVESSGVAIPRSMVRPLVEHVRHGRGRLVHTAAGSVEVTDREWEVLSLIFQRRSTREMADELFVSVGTIRSHVSTLLKKIGAVDRDDAIRLIERGRIDSD